MPTSFLRQVVLLPAGSSCTQQLLFTRSGSIIAKPGNNLARMSFFFTHLPLLKREGHNQVVTFSLCTAGIRSHY